MLEFFDKVDKAKELYWKNIEASKVIEIPPIIIEIQDYSKYNSDYKLIFSLLSELTETPLLEEKAYLEIINNLHASHKIFICMNNNTTPIGIITLIIEQKLIHSGSKVGHIEDFIVKSEFRHLKIGTKLLNYCIEYAQEKKCYKVILDCHESLENYYIYTYFHRSGIQMRINI